MGQQIDLIIYLEDWNIRNPKVDQNIFYGLDLTLAKRRCDIDHMTDTICFFNFFKSGLECCDELVRQFFYEQFPLMLLYSGWK